MNWNMMMLDKQSRFRFCYFFTIFGCALSFLLHYIRIAADIILVIDEMNALSVIDGFLLLIANLAIDFGIFCLARVFIIQLSYLRGKYRFAEENIYIWFPLSSPVCYSKKDIAKVDICKIRCFKGGKSQSVIRVVLKGYTDADLNEFVFRDTYIAKRKVVLLFSYDDKKKVEFMEHNMLDCNL